MTRSHCTLAGMAAPGTGTSPSLLPPSPPDVGPGKRSPRGKRMKSWWRSRPSFPLVLLLLALSTVFLFGNDRGRFYRPTSHDWVSSQHLTIAVNLSPAHGFLMFNRLTRRYGEDYGYAPYNRFPVGGYALISLATLPFRDDLSAQLHAARMLMLAFFAGAAVAAYFATSRLWSGRWVALTAVLSSFSSFYCLYYNDMVHPKTMMDFFGVLLTFHGIVVFSEEGRFRQLLVKACAALLLGWHVLALILAYVALGMASEIVRTRQTVRGQEAIGPPVGPPAALPPRGVKSRRYLTFGVVPLLLAATILTFNFVSEYASYDGGTAWTDLPSVRSMLARTGWNEDFNENYAEALAWSPFLQEQFRRIGRLSMPFALFADADPFATSPDQWRGRLSMPLVLFAGADPARSSLLRFGVAVTVACLVCLAFFRPRLPAAALVASGFCWSLPMRHNTAFHDYECLFYVGIPLVVFAAGTSFASRLFRRAPACLAGAALLVFVLSAAGMSRVAYDAEAAGVQEALMADFEVIRRMTEGARVYVPVGRGSSSQIRFAGVRYAVNYYLAGSVIRYTNAWTRTIPCRPGFVVTRERVENATLLTPENRLMFLYDRADYEAAGQPPLCRSFGRAGGTRPGADRGGMTAGAAGQG